MRQAYIDPERAYVGAEPPVAAALSQVISQISVAGAPWLKTPTIALNPGLVAIIGARGSGKTALADMIAAGCDAASPRSLSDESFLTRARDFLSGASVELCWQAGEPSSRALDGSGIKYADEYPRARYLSQKFVEELCSATSMTDALLREIERVIFESHTLVDREGAVEFDELLDMRATRFRQAREREEQALQRLSERIGIEGDKHKQVGPLNKELADKEKLITGYTADRERLVVKGSEERVKRLAAVTSAAEKVRSYLRFFSNQERSLLALQDEVGDVRTNQAPEMLRRSQELHASSGIKDEGWNPYLLDYKGKVDDDLEARLKRNRELAASWKGTPVQTTTGDVAFVADDAELERQPLTLLEAEIARLEKLIGGDRATAKRYSAISQRIAAESAALTTLKAKLEDCVGAMQRANELVKQREAGYSRIFEAIQSEQNELVALYQPLMSRLAAGAGTLKRLAFSVNREADVGKWAEAGETLIDLRHDGPFKGKGTLLQRAEPILKEPWESGDVHAIGEAMAKFRSEYQEGLLGHSQVPKASQSGYRAWTMRFAQWLYSTDHITLRYSIDYDGVDIRKLSPGTRGIVLLLLYLALDDADDRPLIIDQPEENLDPKSIFDELVGLFVQAKAKRQVIMVTHNANLVVNTDADQIIVAEVGPHVPGQLPPITYTSGGLESASIRRAVCNILEGGERAFQERARRLRVRLER